MIEITPITIHEDYLKLPVGLLIDNRDAELLQRRGVDIFADLQCRRWEDVLQGERLESSRCQGLVRRTNSFAAPVEDLFELIFVNVENRSLHHGYQVCRLQLLKQLSLPVIACEEWQAAGFTCPTTVVRLRQCLIVGLRWRCNAICYYSKGFGWRVAISLVASRLLLANSNGNLARERRRKL